MRKVFSNHTEVCHVWAARSQKEGRASRIFFEGDTIYSYGRHFPMAKFYDVKDETVVLINDSTYSVSTSKHMCYVRSALRGLDKKWFYIDDPERPERFGEYRLRQCLNTINKSMNQHYREKIGDYNGIIEQAVKDINEFNKLFKFKPVKKRDIKPLYEAAAKYDAITQKRLDKVNKLEARLAAMTPEQRQEYDNKQAAKKQKAKDARERALLKSGLSGKYVTVEHMGRILSDPINTSWEKNNHGQVSEARYCAEVLLRNKDLLTAEQINTVVKYAPIIAARREEIIVEQAAARAKEEERKRYLATLIPQAVEAWKNDELNTDDLRDAWALYRSDWSNPTVFRLRNGRVETSRGAQVLELSARKLFHYYTKVMNCSPLLWEGKTKWTSEEPYRIDHYEFRWITAEGDIQIGCHTLTKNEIDDFVTRTGWRTNHD